MASSLSRLKFSAVALRRSAESAMLAYIRRFHGKTYGYSFFPAHPSRAID